MFLLEFYSNVTLNYFLFISCNPFPPSPLLWCWAGHTLQIVTHIEDPAWSCWDPLLWSHRRLVPCHYVHLWRHWETVPPFTGSGTAYRYCTTRPTPLLCWWMGCRAGLPVPPGICTSHIPGVIGGTDVLQLGEWGRMGRVGWMVIINKKPWCGMQWSQVSGMGEDRLYLTTLQCHHLVFIAPNL